MEQQTQTADVRLGALLDTDTWAELLACLPDKFFSLEKAAQDLAFQAMLKAVVRGEKRPDVLAGMVEVY